jgi:hypothetical protein
VADLDPDVLDADRIDRGHGLVGGHGPIGAGHVGLGHATSMAVPHPVEGEGRAGEDEPRVDGEESDDGDGHGGCFAEVAAEEVGRAADGVSEGGEER